MKISFENPDKVNGLMTISVEEEDYKENGTFMIVEVDDESYNKSSEFVIKLINE